MIKILTLFTSRSHHARWTGGGHALTGHSMTRLVYTAVVTTLLGTAVTIIPIVAGCQKMKTCTVNESDSFIL